MKFRLKTFVFTVIGSIFLALFLLSFFLLSFQKGYYLEPTLCSEQFSRLFLTAVTERNVSFCYANQEDKLLSYSESKKTGVRTCLLKSEDGEREYIISYLPLSTQDPEELVAQKYEQTKSIFQNSCFFALAQETKTLSYCTLIENMGSDKESLREVCLQSFS